MLSRFVHNVRCYRFDPFFTHSNGKPLPPSFLPWLLPTTRVWLAAIWFAAVNPQV
jgi:hypothetical protein